MKNIRVLSENFQFLEVKFSIYLKMCVIVMSASNSCPVCRYCNLLHAIQRNC